MASGDIKILIGVRNFTLRQIEKLSPEALFFIPSGYKTNILWNAGHLLASQQLLSYNLSGLEPRLESALIENFRKGTSPGTWKEIPDHRQIFHKFLELPILFEKDYNNQVFRNFKPYQTSAGIELQTIEEAIAYNNFHEGIHLGIIQSIMKLLPGAEKHTP